MDYLKDKVTKEKMAYIVTIMPGDEDAAEESPCVQELQELDEHDLFNIQKFDTFEKADEMRSVGEKLYPNCILEVSEVRITETVEIV